MDELLVPVGIAVAGWLIAHFSRLHFEKRTAQLVRVNEQLEYLYGPLMATLTASHETWVSFTKHHWPSHGMQSYFGQGEDQLSEVELQKWRTWMVNVFHPLNEKVESTIIDNIHLIDGDEIPEAFTQALSHVGAYRAVIAQWESEDYSEHISVNNWPTEGLMDYVKPVFEELTLKQSKLLGKKT